MPVFAALSLSDSVPAAHTFTPRKIVEGIAKWQDKISGIALGFPTITVSLREPLKGQVVPTYKIQLKFIVPKMEVVTPSTYNGITPAPTKAYDCVAVLDFLVPERSTTLERKDLVAYVKNALLHVDIKAIIEDLDFVY